MSLKNKLRNIGKIGLISLVGIMPSIAQAEEKKPDIKLPIYTLVPEEIWYYVGNNKTISVNKDTDYQINYNPEHIPETSSLAKKTRDVAEIIEREGKYPSEEYNEGYVGHVKRISLINDKNKYTFDFQNFNEEHFLRSSIDFVRYPYDVLFLKIKNPNGIIYIQDLFLDGKINYTGITENEKIIDVSSKEARNLLQKEFEKALDLVLEREEEKRIEKEDKEVNKVKKILIE